MKRPVTTSCFEADMCLGESIVPFTLHLVLMVSLYSAVTLHIYSFFLHLGVSVSLHTDLDKFISVLEENI